MTQEKIELILATVRLVLALVELLILYYDSYRA
jgi:hypothetical protein